MTLPDSHQCKEQDLLQPEAPACAQKAGGNLGFGINPAFSHSSGDSGGPCRMLLEGHRLAVLRAECLPRGPAIHGMMEISPLRCQLPSAVWPSLRAQGDSQTLPLSFASQHHGTHLGAPGQSPSHTT